MRLDAQCALHWDAEIPVLCTLSIQHWAWVCSLAWPSLQEILRIERDRLRKSASLATVARVSTSSGSEDRISAANTSSTRSTAMMKELRLLASRTPANASSQSAMRALRSITSPDHPRANTRRSEYWPNR